MSDAVLSHADYQRIAASIEWIAQHRRGRPSVAQMARAASLSTSQFSRLFRRWAGISPQRYLAQLTLGDARAALAGGATVEEAAWDAGLSGAGRLHDLFVTIDAVTPGEFRSAGAGVTLEYGFAPSPFGDALLARSARGVVALRLGDPDDRAERLAELATEWPGARLTERPEASAAIGRLFDTGGGPINVVLSGTPFQHKVWQALLALPPGETVSYAGLAERIGQRGAARAVGSAVGANPVAVLIPCHRVLRADGALGGYRWGHCRKRTLLVWERCRQLAREPATVLSSTPA